jgi:triosephosphate isomerase (TIM)
MKRLKIVAGNWKMNKSYDEGISLAAAISGMLSGGITTRSGEVPLVILAPPSHLLKGVADLTARIPDMETASQNLSQYESGAYTGEISASMVKSTGSRWTLLGHSERRTHFGETDSVLQLKAEQAMKQGLKVIFCVGEVLEERVGKRHFEVVKRQLTDGLPGTDNPFPDKMIIAYEPVWAIGTGLTATPEQAGEMHLFIRNLIKQQYGSAIADATTILYGGSCKPDNAAELFALPDVDGGLIGGASLDPGQFLEIIKAI